jgi:hypothetical protein
LKIVIVTKIISRDEKVMTVVVRAKSSSDGEGTGE